MTVTAKTPKENSVTWVCQHNFRRSHTVQVHSQRILVKEMHNRLEAQGLRTGWLEGSVAT